MLERGRKIRKVETEKIWEKGRKQVKMRKAREIQRRKELWHFLQLCSSICMSFIFSKLILNTSQKVVALCLETFVSLGIYFIKPIYIYFYWASNRLFNGNERLIMLDNRLTFRPPRSVASRFYGLELSLSILTNDGLLQGRNNLLILFWKLQ